MSRAGCQPRTGCSRRGGLTGRAARFLALALLAISGCQGERVDNRPPDVPPMPELERFELERFELAWSPSADDNTPPGAIAYDIGVVRSDVCIVTGPAERLIGQTQLELSLTTDTSQSPFVGFTVRALDAAGISRGYGFCVWGLRAPLRLPDETVHRAPRLRQPPAVGPATACRSDGGDGVWCEGPGELSHLRGLRWQVFALPDPFPIEAWTPLDDFHALVRAADVQLMVSRANGLSASVLSSGSQRFAPEAGAIATGHQRAYLGVRGFVGEFDSRYIDIAGPPGPALGLPGTCDRITQMGRVGAMVYASCRQGDAQVVYLGEGERRNLLWRTEPVTIAGDRVEGVVGTLESGWLAETDDQSGRLHAFDDDGQETFDVTGLAGQGRPIVVLGGDGHAPLAIATREFDFRHFDRRSWESLEGDADRLRWHDQAFPRRSHLVGSRLGVYAVSRERTVRLTRARAELVSVHPGGSVGVRGQDSRYYLFRGPELAEVLSTRNGDSWFAHSWDGPPLEPASLAATSDGSIWVSGLSRQPDQPPAAQRPYVARVGDGANDRTPPWVAAPGRDAPRLAADANGVVFASAAGQLGVMDPTGDGWSTVATLPGQLLGLVGSTSGVIVGLSGRDGQRLLHCAPDTCFELPIPMAAQRPFGAIMAHGDGFCVGLQSRGLWCRVDDADHFVELTIARDLAQRYHLGRDDDWDVVGAIQLDNDVWLLALTTADSGFLATFDPATDQTRLLARNLSWGDGVVLLPPNQLATELERVVVIEAEGPAQIRYGQARVIIPGTLYR